MTGITLASTPAANHSSSVTSALVVTLTAAPAAHNCLVACITAHNAGAVAGVTSAGSPDSWAAGATSDAGAVTSEIWIDPDCAGGNSTVTVSMASSGLLIAQVFEFAGVATSSPLGVVAGADGTLTSSWSSATTGTAPAGSLAVGMCGGTSTSSYTLTGPSSPWVNETPIATSISPAFVRMIAGYQVLTGAATVTYAGTATANQAYGANILTLRPAATTAGGAFLPFFT